MKPEQPQCFVIGPIGSEDSDTRKHADMLLYSVLKHVLEASEFGYKVKRADEETDPGMIGDRIISDILNAELVIADLTDLNPNVFYELGIRHAAEKPTIHVANAGTKLPFDNIGHRTIFVNLSDWWSIEEGRERLTESIRAVRSKNFKVSNPITQANASFVMRQSADSKDQLLAQIQEQLVSIESRLSINANPSNERGIETLNGLSQKETQVLKALLNGHTNRRISDELGISQRTVEVHRSNIMRKTKANSLAGLLSLALSSGLTLSTRVDEVDGGKDA